MQCMQFCKRQRCNAFCWQWMCIPFAWTNPKVESLSSMDVDWIGKVRPEEYWYYLDYALLLIFGGIPWQVYFQRVLSSKTAGRAQILSYVAAAGCILMAIPPVLIGAIAKATGEYHTFNYQLINWGGRLISSTCHIAIFLCRRYFCCVIFLLQIYLNFILDILVKPSLFRHSSFLEAISNSLYFIHYFSYKCHYIEME